jgi:hypothetical protein
VCYMPHPFHPLWFDHSSYIWWREPIMELLLLLLQFFSSIPLLFLSWVHIFSSGPYVLPLMWYYR